MLVIFRILHFLTLCNFLAYILDMVSIVLLY